MKSFFVVFLIITVVSAKNLWCKPGAVFKMDCNMCTCSNDGKTAACTDMECPDENQNFNGIQTVQTDVKQICTPRTQFKNYCNTCTCASDGSSFACTRMMCDKELWNKNGTLKFTPKPSNRVSRNDGARVCEPNTQFKEYCNTCRCSTDGLSKACTMMSCDETLFNKDGSLKSSTIQRNKRTTGALICTPNSQFKEACNTCVCSSDGLSKACTMMTCDQDNEKPSGELICAPNSQFKEACNTCMCSSDGLSKACTMMTCDQDSEKSSGELICTPNSQFKEACNTCMCSSDGLSKACTMMTCDMANKKTAKQLVCTPNSQFKEACNTCMCSNDGLSKACTMMTCDEDDEVSKKTVCTPNSQFKEACNTCVCSSDGLSKACTMMTCGQDENTGKVCVPGTAYTPDGCNTCICDNYGTNFACTRKLCLSTFKKFYEVEETRKWGPVYKHGDTCAPGKSFYSECNRCVCLDDGRRHSAHSCLVKQKHEEVTIYFY